MNARDELALTLANAQRVRNGSSKLPSAEQCSRLAFDDADAVLAAGYRKPRTVTCKHEVEALPDETVIRDGAGDVAEKRGGVWCSYETAPMTNHQLAKYTPIEVLWEPTP